MFEVITALLTTKEAFSAAERQANSLSFLSLAPVEPLLKQSGTGSDAAGLFGGLASKLFISSLIYDLGDKTLYEYDNSVTVFGVPVNSADTVQVQGKNSFGLYVDVLTIWILGNNSRYSFRVGHTFTGVARQ
jgi:hypothetical protein